MELTDVTEIAKQCDFRVFRGTADAGGRVRGINAKGAASKYSRKGHRRDSPNGLFVSQVAKVLHGSRSKKTANSPRRLRKISATNFSAQIGDKMQAQPGDLILFLADTFEVTCKGCINCANALVPS